MIRPDIIVSWPRNCDYPLWRQFIHDQRQRFNEVIIVFTETHQGEDYRDFVRMAMFRDYIKFVDSPAVLAKEDWRNIAINAGLLHSYNSEWIVFFEQDFIVKSHKFWSDVDAAVNQNCDVIGVLDGVRLHPCCLFIKRAALDKIPKNFGVVPDKLDHFGLIQKSIEEQNLNVKILPDDTYIHMAGLSHNMSLIRLGEAPNHNKAQFLEWLDLCLLVKVPQDERFKLFALEALLKYG